MLLLFITPGKNVIPATLLRHLRAQEGMPAGIGRLFFQGRLSESLSPTSAISYWTFATKPCCHIGAVGLPCGGWWGEGRIGSGAGEVVERRGMGKWGCSYGGGDPAPNLITLPTSSAAQLGSIEPPLWRHSPILSRVLLIDSLINSFPTESFAASGESSGRLG